MPHRPVGARPPSTSTGDPLKWAVVMALTPLVTPGPAVSTASPGRRRSLAVPSAANTAVCSCRTSTSRSGGSALTAPSYSGNTWPPERVNISSTPCLWATATASAPPCPSSLVPPTTVTSAPRRPPDATAPPPGDPTRIAWNSPIWPNLPTGHPRVASGTLLPVIRLLVLLTASLTAPPVVPATAPPAHPVAAQLAAPGMERGRPPEASIDWRRSRALGQPNRGRLAGGVELPAAGTHFVTVDPVTGASPNRAWRRHGTDRLLEVLLRVAAEHAAAHPGAPGWSSAT